MYGWSHLSQLPGWQSQASTILGPAQRDYQRNCPGYVDEPGRDAGR